MTANAVPIGARVESTTTIADLIDDIGHRIGGALRHQLLPAAEIAGDLRASGATLGPTINPMLFGDRIRLGDLVLGTHFMWHVLNAVTLYLLLRAAIRYGSAGMRPNGPA